MVKPYDLSNFDAENLIVATAELRECDSAWRWQYHRLMDINDVNKLSLGCFPTPLHELSNLSRVLGGPKIYIKRDDLTGLALGGNKTRKLEFLLAQALAQGCDTVITAGAIQSNHCRQTAAAAAMLGLSCHLVLGGIEPDQVQGNLLLNHLLASHIHWAGEKRKGEGIPDLVNKLEQQGRKPYVVPYGGSNALGALGFVHASYELLAQTSELGENFTHIVFASSSGATHAGLELGKALFEKGYEVLGIAIDKDELDDGSFAARVAGLANNAAERLSFDHQFFENDITLSMGFVGEGYAIISDLEREAITLTAQTEGILLDPVYTGRAMGGLFSLVREGYFKKNDKVLFWHTGGSPALFAYGKELMITN